jgi:hypothetical protein
MGLVVGEGARSLGITFLSAGLPSRGVEKARRIFDLI